MNLREIAWEVVDWIHLAQDRTSGGLLCFFFFFFLAVLLVNGNDKFVPVFLTKHHAIKAYWKSGGIAPLIL
jgi:hypothetical protein